MPLGGDNIERRESPNRKGVLAEKDSRRAGARPKGAAGRRFRHNLLSRFSLRSSQPAVSALR
jgi:hypothetical protein